MTNADAGVWILDTKNSYAIKRAECLSGGSQQRKLPCRHAIMNLRDHTFKQSLHVCVRKACRLVLEHLRELRKTRQHLFILFEQVPQSRLGDSGRGRFDIRINQRRPTMTAGNLICSIDQCDYISRAIEC